MALISSPASTTATATLNVAAWWITDPMDSDNDASFPVHSVRLDTSATETQGRFVPLGRTRAVYVGDALLGESGELELAMVSRTVLDQFEELRAGQRTLLLRSPYSDTHYIRMGPTRKKSMFLNKAFQQKFTVVFSFEEVDAPGEITTVQSSLGYGGGY